MQSFLLAVLWIASSESITSALKVLHACNHMVVTKGNIDMTLHITDCCALHGMC